METDLTTQITPAMLALIPLVAAVLQVLRKVEAIDKYKAYMPFMAIVLSAGAIYAMNQQIEIIPAVVMGLMASGVYDGVKAISK